MPDNTCVCCGAVIPEGRHICLSCEGQNEMQRFVTDKPKPKTNGDRIRAMTDDELAAFLYNITSCCYFQKCKDCQFYHVYNCDYVGLKGWLKSEVQGNA